MADWREDAACIDSDPEIFFPLRPNAHSYDAALRVCAACPVRRPCLELALASETNNDDRYGMFGGTMPVQRRALQGKRSGRPSGGGNAGLAHAVRTTSVQPGEPGQHDRRLAEAFGTSERTVQRYRKRYAAPDA